MADKARHKIRNLLMKLNDEDRIGKERPGGKGQTMYFVEFWEEDADA